MEIYPQKNNPTVAKNEVKPASDLLPGGEYQDLVLQIQAEHDACEKHIDPKVPVWQRRLKIYNNQRRDDDKVGDTLLFTVMQTVIASLYDDQLQVEFRGHNDGDEGAEQNLNTLATEDHKIMRKEVFDYYWLWNTAFFGRSVVYFTNFDRKKKTPIPDLQNMMLFYRDPKAVAINGDAWNGRNACRFFGRWIEQTKDEMNAHPEYFDVDMVRPCRKTDSKVEQARQALQDAQGLNSELFTEGDFKENTTYENLEWCTHYKGEKVLVVLANDKTKVIRVHKFKDADKKPAKIWPVIDRPMYPSSNDWDGTSIPDLIEDKQRMRAIMKNLSLKHLQADLYPMYVYNKKRFKNPQSDFNFGFNKFIGMEGEGNVQDGVQPLQKSPMNAAIHQYVLDSLSQDAEKATATPQMQQGNLNDEKRLATELNMIDRNTGTRYSLTAKVFGWSERDYWLFWYMGYKMHFKDGIDKKVLRLEGIDGPKWRELTRENFIMLEDPDVNIVSRYVSRQEKATKKMEWGQYLQLVGQVQGSNMRYGIKKLGKLMEFPLDEIERLLPKSIDEMMAEEENAVLNKNKTVYVNPNDNHQVHLEVHSRAGDTVATYGHVEAHKQAMLLMKGNPDLFPQAKEAQMKAERSENPPANPGTGAPMDQMMEMLNASGGAATTTQQPTK